MRDRRDGGRRQREGQWDGGIVGGMGGQGKGGEEEGEGRGRDGEYKGMGNRRVGQGNGETQRKAGGTEGNGGAGTILK